MMKSRLNLKPLQKGTKRLVERFGKMLLYVRYQYDEERGLRLKTVELVIEEKPWQPSSRLKNGDLVLVAVEYVEKELREQVKAAGGKWDPSAKMWRVPYGAIKGTGLEKRIHAPARKG
jgi:hypothetical protein